MSLSASNLGEEIGMSEETKRVNLEREPLTERETGSDELRDQVTNDSLGTTDIADSTGLDADQPTGEAAKDRRSAGNDGVNP
jgi:hypothetical protein